MPQPFDYSIRAEQPNIMQGIMQGVQLAGILDQRDQMRIQQEQAQQMQRDLGALGLNPSPSAIAAMMVKYPQLAEKFKPSLEALTAQQKESRLSQASSVYAAVQSGRTDIAKDLLEKQALAFENSGDKEGAGGARTMLQLLDSPEGVNTFLGSAGTYLAAAMGPDKFAEAFSKLGMERRAEALAPEEQKKLRAEAQSAATKAKFAESETVLDLEQKGWNIRKLQEDIKINRENSRIAAMNASLAREANAIKREELQLKLQEAKDNRERVVRERVAEYSGAVGTLDNMLSTTQQIMNVWSQDPDTVKAATGPMDTRTPTLLTATANFEELINTLGSQAFLAQVGQMRGLGALTESEGKKLQAGLQNLSLRQGPEQLMRNVKEIQRIMIKGRENLALKYGVPQAPSDLAPDVYQPEVLVDY